MCVISPTVPGHELQHAVEVADDVAVRDAQSLMQLYERIGFCASQDGCCWRYDSAAARAAGDQVAFLGDLGAGAFLRLTPEHADRHTSEATRAVGVPER